MKKYLYGIVGLIVGTIFGGTFIWFWLMKELKKPYVPVSQTRKSTLEFEKSELEKRIDEAKTLKAKGMSTAAIAKAMGRAESTVRSYLSPNPTKDD